MLVQDLVRRRSTLAKRAWIALVERANVEHAAAVHVTSDIEAAELECFGFRLPPVYCIANGVEPAASSDDGLLDAAAKPPTVLALGRIHWKKGLDRLIEAMALVPGAKLLIVGNDEDGYSGTLRALAASRGIADRLEIRGPVFGDEKQRLYRRSTLLALPSLSENFGNVVLEAIAAGCPVVVTPEVGAASIVREVGGGIVAEGDPRSLAHAIRSLLGDAPLRHSGVVRARERVLREYSWDAVAGRMMDAYGGVAGRTAGA
jgi:glycosyltransferase involved in cell wall biosynthesis